jgi:hypothetical protein
MGETMSKRIPGPVLCALFVALLAAGPARPLDGDEEIGFERTPPRLAFIDGEVSFWRPGAGDWAPAQVNTALAAGDELFTGGAANLELQVDAAAFVRAGENTQLGLTGLEPDFLQLRVTEGHVSLDLRSRSASQTIEIDTPNAAFTIEKTGYYRVEVNGETTTFTSRRGGRATVTTAAGTSAVVAPSEQLVVIGTDAPATETYAASELDAWDRWNYERTDEQLDAVSARYVPAGVYGVDNLDHHGDWRLVPTYGAVWVPRGVPVGWAPYSTGRWMYDPYYDWTWVDDAPWGWAPYHYGRWVYTSGYWGWCPGRVVARPYYSPALVAFYGGGGFSVGVSFGAASVGWVALGWGEPLLPWWGPVGYRGVPRWRGWGGPRVVNNVVINQKTVINVRDIQHYRNAGVRDAMVTVDRDRFGRRSGAEQRYARGDASRFRPVHGELGVRPDRSSLVASTGEARRPARQVRERSVVAVREPRVDRSPELGSSRNARSSQQRARTGRDAAQASALPTRLVQPADGSKRIETSRRPPFARSGGSEREIAPPAPRFEQVQREEATRRDRQRPEAAAGKVPDAPSAAAPERGRARRAPAQQAPAAARERGSSAEPVPTAERGQRVRTTRAPAIDRQGAARVEPSPPSPPEPSRSALRSGGSTSRSEREPTAVSRSRAERASRSTSSARSAARERAAPSTRQLPGEPANRVKRQPSERAPRAEPAAPRQVQAPRSDRQRQGGGELRAAQPQQRGGGEMRGAQSRQGGGGRAGGAPRGGSPRQGNR